ncbi:DUF4367 domain-containing protein [Beduinella massiliensis]|uniref:DUF4367 domain-containing protein n=1 Tax=Beduinella massiliensis TaxID=1852363 RepID=UPI0031F7AFCE
MRRKQKKAYLAWLNYVITKDEMTREEAFYILKGQLLLPAEEVDCGLIDKCLDHLYPDRATRTYPTKEPTWQRIMQTYQEKEANRRRKKIRKKRRSLRPGIAIALFILLAAAAGSTIAYALGVDVWSSFVSWTKDIMSIETHISAEPEPQTTSESVIPPIDKRIGFGRGDAFDRELERLGMEPRLPSWMPEGLEYDSFTSEIWESGTIYLKAIYRDQLDRSFTIIVEKISSIGNRSDELEKNTNDPVTFGLNNVEFVIAKNIERFIMQWQDKPYVLTIRGNLTQEELVKMAESIFMED